eukprot:TRINITY_DN3437_c0_g1_i2.p1 TRINITY_DN3437_c0_g1~~TRINITY_DN3437_c0_g1_i2.p1  ORF type:complete len:501 (+),score=79.23 TRINITY_DN3437_c0_g1_i2:149-1651(+)
MDELPPPSIPAGLSFAQGGLGVPSLGLVGDEPFPPIPPALPSLTRQWSHQVLEETGIFDEQARQIEEIAGLLEISKNQILGLRQHRPLATASALLRAFRWDSEKFLLAFFDDPVATCAKAGIVLENNPVGVDEGKEILEFTCEVCACDFPIAEGLACFCRHYFDVDCWKGHLQAKLDEGPNCVFARCPAAGCKEVPDESIWTTAFKDEPEKLKLYKKFLVQSYVSLRSDSIKWCSGPNCNKAIMYSGERMDVECECGYKMCWRCSEAAHSPALCDQLKAFSLKADSEAKDIEEVMKMAKSCPKCKVMIHRYDGCNHMTCSRCRHEFCWMCKAPWSTHGSHTGGYYDCQLYDPNKNYEEGMFEMNTDKLLTSVRRFEHHNVAMQKLKSKINGYRDQLKQESNREYWPTLQLMLSVTNELMECHRTLRYSHVFFFFLSDSAPDTALYGHRQQMLEQQTEKLSSMVSSIDFRSYEVQQIRSYAEATKVLCQQVAMYHQLNPIR